jgi:universal stress protein A
MLPISAILWPTDGSKPALRALNVAIELAQTFKAKLYALQVVNQVPTISETGFTSASEIGFDVPLYEQELLNTAKDTLNNTVVEKVPKTVEVETHVELGVPADVIIDFAGQKNVSLIVMSTHGRTGISHLVLGSVAEKTVRKSSIPVLTIPGETENK